ncbi:MAG TPA: choice-of-anchor J domain-containing protein [Flavobacteriaceae bacterium]|nr:choice-of-anchor J domain-containing protein [Flavobacteriaceae bacterium]
MKRFLLILMICGLSNFTFAQTCNDTLPITESFDDSNVIDVCWDTNDQDGDGHNWYWRDYGSFYGGFKCLTSRSYLNTGAALTPDNWIISHAIDLTSFSTNQDIELSWKVRGELASHAHEYYTVYAATGNQISDFTSSGVYMSEYADEAGASGVFVTRSMDISSLAGNIVYIAFRHYNSSNQYILNIDDVIVTESSLNISSEELNAVNISYHSNADILTLKSPTTPLSEFKLYSILGQLVLTEKLSQNEELISLSTLKDGVYIAQLFINGANKTFKFVKR